MKRLFLVGLLVLLLALASCGGGDAVVEGEIQVDETAQEAETVKVAVMVPLSGDVASYGEAVLRGVELALADMELENVELVTEDSLCDAKEAATAMTKLATVDNVVAVVGELCSSATLAAAPIAEQYGVVMVSPASTSPSVTDAGDYLFRTIPSDALQGDFGSSLVADLGYEKLAVLYINDDYGVGFKDVLEATFSGEIVATEAIETGAVDVRTQLTKIKEAGADSVYIISNSPDSAVAALEQIVELGLDVAVFGSEGLKADYITENAGAAAEGLYVSSVSAGTDAFQAAHETTYGEGPGPFGAQAYDAMTAIGMTIEAGATTGDAIKDALYALSFEGVTGTITFDENGDVYGNYLVYHVEDGAFVLVE